jgi:hypothetical protein
MDDNVLEFSFVLNGKLLSAHNNYGIKIGANC